MKLQSVSLAFLLPIVPVLWNVQLWWAIFWTPPITSVFKNIINNNNKYFWTTCSSNKTYLLNSMGHIDDEWWWMHIYSLWQIFHSSLECLPNLSSSSYPNMYDMNSKQQAQPEDKYKDERGKIVLYNSFSQTYENLWKCEWKYLILCSMRNGGTF